MKITDLLETKKKPNATTRHLRDYPVSDKDVAKPVKKPEKKKPEQGIEESASAGATGSGSIASVSMPLGGKKKKKGAGVNLLGGPVFKR